MADLDIPAWVALFLELTRMGKKPGEAVHGVAQAAQQRLPNALGIGRADEQLFESLRQLLSPAKRRLVDLVIGAMKDYEEDIFRLTVAGMSCGSEVVDKPVKNPAKGAPTTTKEAVSWEFTAKDLRVKYLEDIADEASHQMAGGRDASGAATLVVEGMRARRLITRSPIAQKVHDREAETLALVKKEVIDFFGVKSLDEITPRLAARYINLLARKVPYRRPADMNIGFWRSSFRNNPKLTMFLVTISILMAAIFAVISTR